MTLTELADRVERLTGPCRETDARIDCYLKGATEFVWQGHYYKRNGIPNCGGDEVPCYTASLDAAMTLVPEGLPILIRDGYDDAPGDKRPYAHVMNEIGEGYAATKALAIVVAALRARASMEADRG